MKAFTFSACNVGVEGARTLADCLRRNSFPVLNTIGLGSDSGIGDVGVVALAKALVEAPQSPLTSLGVSSVGICKVGMAALASAVQQGKFERLGRLELKDDPGITDDSGITDEGIIALAQAIDARGLPALKTFVMLRLSENVTILAFSAITHALVKGSPNLAVIRMRRCGPKDATLLAMIKGMLRAARRTAAVIDV